MNYISCWKALARCGCAAALVLLAAAPLSAQHGDPPIPAPNATSDIIIYPPFDENVDSYDMRAAGQRQTLSQFQVFTDFTFSNKQTDSGITFQHRIVDDCGKYSKAVHYDHGTGMAAADVDGDGLVDIYFISQLGGNQLWKNVGGGKFANITADAGVGLNDGVSVGASFADIDNDGDEDLYVTTVRTGNALFENDGKGHFTNITDAAGLTYSGHSSGATWFDYDRDGKLDLFVDNIGKYTTDVRGRGGYFVGVPDGFQSHLKPERREDSLLYHNLGGNKFENVTAAMGVGDNGFDGDASFNDVNGDGFPDLYVLCMQGDNHYYENDAGMGFVDKTAEVFPKTSWGAMGLKFFDYNNDGRADLYITDMHSDMGRDVPPGSFEKLKSIVPFDENFTQGSANNIFGNTFFQKAENGQMQEVSDSLGVENYWPWGVSVADLNADGWDDLFVTTGMNFPFRYTGNQVLLNNQAKNFLDSEFILGVEPRANFLSPWFELECSGEDASYELCAGQTGHKTVYASSGSKTSVAFDVDADGDIDIVTVEFNDYPQVLLSNLSEKKQVNYVSVKLAGTESNFDGLGARVTVRASGGQTFTKWNDGKSGYLGQSAMPLYFGLGDSDAVRSIEVLWPSGQRTVTRNVQARRVVTLNER